jgi:hypothetical protein
MRNIQKEVETTRNGALIWGYRPVTEADLVPGCEMIMVEVERFTRVGHGLSPRLAPGCAIIELDNTPVASSRAGIDKKVVLYHCKVPQWDGQCFVPLDDFVRDAYIDDLNANDTRYFVKN